MSANYMGRAVVAEFQVEKGSGTTVSACKLALIVLASCVDPKASRPLAFPSMDERVRRSGQDKRTIRLCDDELIRQGLIADTGERRGRTGQIIVYSFPAWESAKGDNPAPLSAGKAGQKEEQQEEHKEGQYCPPYREDRSYPSDMSDREKLSLSEIHELKLSGEAERKASLWPPDFRTKVEHKFRALLSNERHSAAQWNARFCKWVIDEHDPVPSDGPANPLVRAALAIQADEAPDQRARDSDYNFEAIGGRYLRRAQRESDSLKPYKPRISEHGH